MKKHTGIIALSAGVLLSAAGCIPLLLPPGEPPPGPIVETPLPAERDRRGAENDAVTSLFAYTLQNCPGAAVAVEADAAMTPVARRIIDRTGKISGIHYAPAARFILRADAADSRWSFQLFDAIRKSIVWQEVFVLKP